MCGIFAALQPRDEVWPDAALRMATDALSHRGPDASGYWRAGGVFLGHRRLSIIDLESGAQPMFSHDGRYGVTFNGEIYNYRDLRDLLARAGHTFHTHSDTEVILEAYRRWGTDSVRHLNGMFAFALWDRKTRTLFAARDRLGIKPFVWTTHRGGLLLSSTLEPLLSLPNLPRVLDYDGLRDVLTFDYVLAPRTILAGVHKLRPGHRLVWRPDVGGEPTIDAYWDIPAPQSMNGLDREELLAEVEAALEQAVARQMMSDVPLGAFLSGGVDSSLLVALMARHSNRAVKTFSIAFRDEAYDESLIAREVAEQVGADHTVLHAEEATGEDVLEIIGRLDEPFTDTALVPTFILSGLARQHVTVALSGDGADEVFGGYGKYLLGEDRVSSAPWRPLIRPVKFIMDRLPIRPPGGATLYKQTLTPHERIPFMWTHYSDYPVARKDLRQVLANGAYAQIDAARFFEPWLAHAARWDRRYTTDLLIRADLRTYLSENCLVKTDRASMMQSLEVRVPYLDELVLDRVLALPAPVKIRDGQLKSLLLPLAQRLLPRSVWDRPKHGFSVPIGHYLAGPWRSLVDEMLVWGEVNAPIFDYVYLRRLVARNERRRSADRDLWNPLVILIWLRRHQGRVSL